MAALCLSVFSSAPLRADVSGTWNTTGLTRIVVSSISFPETAPERTVEIGDGRYVFGAEREFTAGDIAGSWKQRSGRFTVRPNRAVLEAAYIQALLDSENPPFINSVRLVRGEIAGSELDNGIWGTETYVYRLDLGEDQERQVLRVAMTVRVAGQPPNPAATAQAAIEPSRSLAELAAAAVLRYRLNHPAC
jgi:hypothetical protein